MEQKDRKKGNKLKIVFHGRFRKDGGGVGAPLTKKTQLLFLLD